AMKMENEIFSPEDGVVTQVFVTKGASVNTNDALISMQ
ncbi:MAG TPA: acetyl-CoA carboxylase biotin carboxyl carrier protein subunit, partial [Clostridiales bacterium]|nr:acetyl-CoA carboxylase biotin carboxyl carrier protein subunit [Clostridiales bacterium]HBE14184.1 acetyl-CoA carboxylase biotin carboxyl carrier protein subunit [Clostridiales bacterium]